MLQLVQATHLGVLEGQVAQQEYKDQEEGEAQEE
jgi:hypothetical protein